ncbi:lysophospholipid acyltransferase family protein [Kitasatospora sp. NPDC058170]|uniref:lysophospholipid acyltransferase family protein n=1 Tax=Kitasatospora sp. NPDC058170 TaxID=3346364 RepID=UPI0036DE4D79
MSVWLPTATCTPRTCLTEPGPVVARSRRVLRLAVFLVVLLTGLALVPPVRALPRGPRHRLVRAWARALLGALGVTVRFGPDPGAGEGAGGAATGVLVVANHVSWLDIPLIAARQPGRSIAKTEVRRWPVLGPLVAWGGTVFLDRDRLRALPAAVDTVAAALRAGHPVVVFPEGSTWCGKESGRFRPALFQAAVQAGAPVQPVTIRYRLADGTPTSAAAFVGEDGLLSSLARVLAVRGLVAEVTFLPPIPAPAARTGRGEPGCRARRDLARTAQAAVEAVGR